MVIQPQPTDVLPSRQAAAAMPAGTPAQALLRTSRMVEVCAAFRERAEEIVRLIVVEAALPVEAKSIKVESGEKTVCVCVCVCVCACVWAVVVLFLLLLLLF